MTTNRAIDSLKKAYKKREVYSGTWLPEVLPDSLINWDNELEKKESLRTSFLILLENLSPKERAVYILREVFEYHYKEIAEFTHLTESNCRKIFQRAHNKVDEKSSKYDDYNENSLAALETFFESALSGSEDELKKILHSESEFWSDGGGKATAVRSILYHSEKIARFFGKIFISYKDEMSHYKFEYIFVNNSPGVVISKKVDNSLWSIETIFTFEMIENKIARIYAQRNPDKLNFVSSFLKSDREGKAEIETINH